VACTIANMGIIWKLFTQGMYCWCFETCERSRRSFRGQWPDLVLTLTLLLVKLDCWSLWARFIDTFEQVMIKTELTIHRLRKYSRNHKYNTHTCALQTLKHFTSQNTQTRYIFPCIRCVYCVHSGIAWTNCTNEPCMSSTYTQTWCSAVYVHSGIEWTNCTNETCMSSTYTQTWYSAVYQGTWFLDTCAA